MYSVVQASKRKRDKTPLKLLENVLSLSRFRLLFFTFVCCATIYHFTQISSRTQLHEKKDGIPQGNILTECRTNMKNMPSSESLLKYSCKTFCETIERVTRRLQKEISASNEIRKSKGNVHNKKKSRVIIVSYKRSGSSFLGEIFNRHQDVLYLYEPLHSLTVVGEEGTAIYHSMIKHLLRVIMSCRYAEHPYYVGYSNDGEFRLRSRALSKSCVPNRRPGGPNKCDNIDSRSMTAICESHQHIVVKSIRIKNIDILQSVLGSEKTTRIIHLVRDPRAVISSRRELNETEDQKYSYKDAPSLRKSARDLCRQMLRNLKQGAAIKEWVGHYHVIRYEDVATRPIYAVKELYNYVGIKQSQEIFDWIRKNTNAKKKTHFFSTTKNATVSINKWKSNLDLKTIRLVEQECREVMIALGYKLVSNQSVLAGVSSDTYGKTFSELANEGRKGIFVTETLHDALEKKSLTKE